MPAPIISGFITFLQTQLDVTVWDGEVPLYDTSGNPVNTSATATSPLISWPVVKLYMPESGFTRQHDMADPYSDDGELICQVWATTRTVEETLLSDLEAVLVLASNWPLIELGGPVSNPFAVYKVVVQSWYSGQIEGARTSASELVYLGQLNLQIFVHGAISSFF